MADHHPRRVSRAESNQAMLVAVNAAAAVIAVVVARGEAAGAVAFVAVMAGAQLLDHHRAHRLSPSALDDVATSALRGTVVAALATVLGVGLVGRELPGVLADAGPLVTVALYTVVAVIGMGVAGAVMRRLRAGGRLTGRALIVGTRGASAEIASRLCHRNEYGLEPIGFVDRVDDERAGSVPVPVPVVGDVTALPKLVAEHDADCVFVGDQILRRRQSRLAESRAAPTDGS